MVTSPAMARRRSGGRPAVLVAVLAAAVSGCAPDATPKAGTTPPVLSVTSVPQVTDSTHLSLPVMPFLLSDDETRLLGRAHAALIDTCMIRFDVAPPPPIPDPSSAGPETRTERRYGLTDPELARTHGYHLRADPPVGDAPAQLTADQELVLMGPTPAGTEFHGRTVPQGGCAQEATRALGGDLGNAELIQRVDVDSILLAMKHVRVREAFRAWSACMAARGHAYATPWDPPNDDRFSGPVPAPAEPAVAVDDVACKAETNVVGVWHAVDVAYQSAMIDEASAEFEQIADTTTARLESTRDLLDER